MGLPRQGNHFSRTERRRLVLSDILRSEDSFNLGGILTNQRSAAKPWFCDERFDSARARSAIIYPLSFVRSERIQRGFFKECLDRGVTHVVLAGAGLHLLKGRFHDFAASVSCFSGKTRFNDPSRISVEACTKPSRITQFECWLSSGVVSAHAHEITIADAREVSSCCLRESKKFEKVWLSLRQTIARKNHVCAFLPLSLGSFISGVADSDSLPANMKTNSQEKG